jgi:osmotically inducible lipoprotein OsmB
MARSLLKIMHGPCMAQVEGYCKGINMLYNRIMALLLATTLALGGCAGMSTRQKNAAVGAAVGGVAGAVLTGGSSVGTVGGAAIGGVIGHGVDGLAGKK